MAKFLMTGLVALLMLAAPAASPVVALDRQTTSGNAVTVTAVRPGSAYPASLPSGGNDAIGSIINEYGSTRKVKARTPTRKPSRIGRSTHYRVKAGDLLEISIWKEPDMRREMLVLPDGTISYPLAGHTQVVGMTPKQIEDLLTKRLARYFKNPFISVIVKRATGNQIYVLGEVRNPGAFTINQPVDVMQALSLAGGLSEFADKGEIVVLRRTENGKQEVISFKYSTVQRGKNLSSNITLVSGDTVVVPERGLF